ncbi:MAG: hypothetical protein ACLGPM_05890 [Acidobacteriota bacterium]
MITPSIFYVTSATAALLALALFNQWTSRINQHFFFSRSAPEGFGATAAGRQITAAYRAQVWQAFALALVLFALLLWQTRLSVGTCFAISVFVEWIGCSVAFGRAHSRAGAALAQCAAEPPATSAGSASQPISVALTQGGPFTPGLMWMLFLAAAFAAAAWVFPMIAMKMSIGQFASAIEANKADFLSGLGLGLLSASLVLFVQLRYLSRHRSPLARFSARGCVEAGWIGALAIALSTFSVPLHLVISAQERHIIVALVLVYAALRVLYAWSRPRNFPPPAIERSGDQFWRWGMFYYNPSDPTLFIQHRCGPGYTLNFANLLSWPLMLLFVADLVFLSVIHLWR